MGRRHLLRLMVACSIACPPYLSSKHSITPLPLPAPPLRVTIPSSWTFRLSVNILYLPYVYPCARRLVAFSLVTSMLCCYPYGHLDSALSKAHPRLLDIKYITYHQILVFYIPFVVVFLLRLCEPPLQLFLRSPCCIFYYPHRTTDNRTTRIYSAVRYEYLCPLFFYNLFSARAITICLGSQCDGPSKLEDSRPVPESPSGITATHAKDGVVTGIEVIYCSESTVRVV